MNFAFSEVAVQAGEAAREVLREAASGAARRAFGAGVDAALWARVRGLGWLGAAIPEAFGGSSLGEEGLCLIAEALGESLAPVPFAGGAYVAAPALLRFGSAAQQARWLPGIADGSVAAAWALSEGPGAPEARAVGTVFRDGALTGVKWPVVDGTLAQLALVVARDGAGEVGVYLAPLEGVSREALAGLDPSRGVARLAFERAPAELLASGWSAVEAVLARAAVFVAFEQLGGAHRALMMARDYALERQAFGRKIGSFQAVKHKLADVYVAIELARSHAFYAVWAMMAEAPDFLRAAAAARVAATRAFEMAAAETIQVHGGMGFTWDSDCHLFYRRSKHLALCLGGIGYWKDILVRTLEQRNAA